MTRTSTAARLVVTALLCVAAAPAAGAQERGAVEVGAAIRWMSFDGALRLPDDVGPAIHLGAYVSRRFSIEGQVSRHALEVGRPGIPEVRHRTAYLRALVHRPLVGSTRLHAGAAWAYASYDGLATGGDHGPGVVLGLRRRLAGRLALRVDGTADYYPSPGAVAGRDVRAWNVGMQAGASFLWGRLAPGAPPPPPDADADGIVDADDRCPGTPMGERVDARGCPQPAPAGTAGTAGISSRP